MVARFIAFEGGEGSGKSTQAALLAERLGAVLTREPGGTDLGWRLRAVLLDPEAGIRHELDHRAEALLMAADRAQHISEVVRPALAAGRWVVSDRSLASSLAYQGYGRGLPLDELVTLSHWASQGLWPDLFVLLDVPAEVAGARVGHSPDRMERAGADFHARVREGYRHLADADATRWVVLDGAGDEADVAARVAAAVREHLGDERSRE